MAVYVALEVSQVCMMIKRLLRKDETYFSLLLHGGYCGRLLQQDPEVTSLLQHDPFKKEKPNYIRIEKYRYKFCKRGKRSQGNKEQYWDREWIGQVYSRQGVASEEDLEAVVEAWRA